MPDQSPLLSIIVCTHNRAAQLEQAFASFEALRTSRPFEVVFVDNASTDHTTQALQAFCARRPGVFRAVAEPRAGVSTGRNTGARHARGDILAFTDDDCYPAPDYVDRVAQCFEEDPTLSFMGGRLLLHDPRDLPMTIQTLERRVAVRSGAPVDVGLIHGANMALRREAFFAVGGFDERMGPGAAVPAAEDLDLIARVAARGYAGAYDPRPLVYHHHRRQDPADVARLERSYEIGRGAFFAKALLRAETRRIYWKPVYWDALRSLQRRQFGTLVHCLQGALLYMRLQ